MGKLKGAIILILCLLIPLAVGLYVRLDDLQVWNKNKSRFYYGERPIFTGYDAFYFARYGKEFSEGTYRAGERDPLKFVPDGANFPSTIPMLSFIGSFVSEMTNSSIESVSLWLIPSLSVLFVVPLVLYFHRLGLPLAGFGGALLGVVSFVYLVRTSVARFDTDALNLFFPFAIALFLLRSLYSKGRTTYLNLILAGVLSQLYHWWYAHPGINLTIFLAYCFALLLFKEIPKRDKLVAVIVLFISSNPLILLGGVFNLVGLVKIYIINFFKPAVGGGFPNVMMSISEAQRFDLLKTAEMSSGNVFLFSVGLAGLVLLILKRFKDLLPILPLLLIGLMALKGGQRFGMYLAPFIGIGVGYIAERLSFYIKDAWVWSFKVIAIASMAILFLFSNEKSLTFLARPVIPPGLVGDFLKLSTLTPTDSWVWTWWDYGNMVQYFSERATFHDGQGKGPKTYFVATTFATPDPAVAHNVILGVSRIGAEGIRELLKKGKSAEKIRDMLFSGAFSRPAERPIYWVFVGDMIGKFPWIHYFGTWDFSQKRGRRAHIRLLRGCKEVGSDMIVCGRLVINLRKGTDLGRGVVLPFRKGLHLEVVSTGSGKLVFLVPVHAFYSMFNQMYILRNFDKDYFELVYDNFPTMVVYRVLPINRMKP